MPRYDHERSVRMSDGCEIRILSGSRINPARMRIQVIGPKNGTRENFRIGRATARGLAKALLAAAEETY